MVTLNYGFDTRCTVVLVASDAIGMGLNLNIRRLIFTKLEKFDGIQKSAYSMWYEELIACRRYLTESEAKQIAGRAGRYGGTFPEGHVTWYE